MKWSLSLMVALGLLAVGLLLVGCGATTEPCPTAQPCPETECPTVEACPACPEVAACPTAEACPACPTAEAGAATAGVTTTCPFGEQWASSAHADGTAEAFNHWNEADPKEVPATCAQCHSSSGYQAYVAGIVADPAFVLDTAAPIGSVVDCQACHNAATPNLSIIPFPSGITVTVDGPQARCMVCHQGRAAGSTVDGTIAKAGLTDDDTVSPDLGFTNVHYKAAAATQYGTWVKGGYEYEGKAYDVKFDHVEGLDTCIGCHDQHTLELRIEVCGTCHGVKSVDELKDVREPGSARDYNGNGNIEEGIYYEIKGLQDMLYQAIQAYAADVSKTPIVYSADSYPYFFKDANANGQVDEDEGKYDAFTGRLAKAAYNYQFSIKDPGSYAHNGKYIIELLYDSIASLNEKLSTPVDLSKAAREDAGHFDGAAEAFRHWDEGPDVEAGCVRCHQAEGLPQLLENGANIAMPQSGSLHCTTCHDEANWPARYEVTTVSFPSGASVDSGNPDSNICLECHQGRESTVSVNRAIAGMDPDTPSDKLRFRNVHYFAAGATLFGHEVQGAYEYEGKEYVGRNEHVDGFNNCTQCHDSHALAVKTDACKACHTVVQSDEDLTKIRMSTVDYDGDGDSQEGIAGEIATMTEALYKAIQDYAAKTAGTAILYNPAAYPYFFADANANGTLDEGEAGYATWTPRLLKAAYNLQYAYKDPGDFAHNPKYVIEFLYDSIQDLGGDVSGMTRP
jgi:hypothetical protein